MGIEKIIRTVQASLLGLSLGFGGMAAETAPMPRQVTTTAPVRSRQLDGTLQEIAGATYNSLVLMNKDGWYDPSPQAEGLVFSIGRFAEPAQASQRAQQPGGPVGRQCQPRWSRLTHGHSNLRHSGLRGGHIEVA